jgi:glycosyltransferase involved in cell wall biosynthesis
MAEVSISVVIPSYNVEEYIGSCLQSVIEQTHKPDEIICVDDASKDKTVSIIRSFMERHPFITLIEHKENKGAPTARNEGMAVSKGNYIQFLDADDLLLPKKFEHQVKLLQSVDPMPDILVGSFSKKFINGSEKQYINTPADKWSALMDNRIGVTSANLFKRETVEAVGGWSEYLKSSQEYDLMFRMLQHGATVHFDPVMVNVNRDRVAGSITKTDPAEKWKRYINLRVRIYDYLLSMGELTKEREDTFRTNLLNSLRTLYIYNRKAALEYYNKYMKGKALPVTSKNATSAYRILYNILGFDLTQKITMLLKGRHGSHKYPIY